MQGFLVSGERKRYQSLESLMIIKGLQGYQSIFQYLVGKACRRSAEKVQELGGIFLWENCYHVIKIHVGDSHIPDGKLSICLGKSHLSCIGPEGWELHRHTVDHRSRRRKQISNLLKLGVFFNFVHVENQIFT